MEPTDPAAADLADELIRAMAEMTTLTPDITHLVDHMATLGRTPEEVADRLDAAISLGLVEAVEDLGPDTLFVLSTLAAERLGVEPTFDNRRWQDTRSGRLVGLHETHGRRRGRHATRDERPDLPHVLYGGVDPERVDPRQVDPHDDLVAAEEAARAAARKPYSSDNPPYIRRFYGLGAIWKGEEIIKGFCPYCRAEEMGIDGYCTKCHRSGMDATLPKPEKSRRRQMPATASSLKGGV